MIHVGNCLEVMPTLEADSFDSIVTDPPYGLGFMGKEWDHGVPGVDFWKEALRVAKPGAHIVAFGGTRTFHRLACALEDAGWEIRDTLMWVYGSGFPKSLDVSKAIDKMGGQPWGEFAALLEGLIKSAGYNYTSLDRELGIPSAGSNSCYWVRTDSRGGLPPRHYYERLKTLLNPPKEFTDLYDKAEREVIATERRRNAPSGLVGLGRESIPVEREITVPATEAAKQWQGWGTALKPAWEPIILARKPLSGTVAANVQAHRTGALNIDGCRVLGETMPPNTGAGGLPRRADDEQRGPGVLSQPSDLGRWPANVLHDGSDEVVALFPSEAGAQAPIKGNEPSVPAKGDVAYGFRERVPGAFHGDTGGAARFFGEFDFNDEDWTCCNLSLAPNTNGCFSLQSEAVSTALKDAATLVLPEGILCSGWTAPSTDATPTELRRIADALITKIQNIGCESWHASLPEKPIHFVNPAKVVVRNAKTAITTITVSHWKLDGSADPVTFDITAMNSEAGGKDCARFKYCAKASREDRNDGCDDFAPRPLNWSSGSENPGNFQAEGTNRSASNFHPTVKPTDLMRWLCRLVTPPGGLVLDPFTGSGSTGRAAIAEGMRFVGIEQNPAYAAIAAARCHVVQPGLGF